MSHRPGGEIDWRVAPVEALGLRRPLLDRLTDLEVKTAREVERIVEGDDLEPSRPFSVEELVELEFSLDRLRRRASSGGPA